MLGTKIVVDQILQNTHGARGVRICDMMMTYGFL